MDLAIVLKEKISKVVLSEYGIQDADFIIEHPQNESFGDYATNVALVLSKKINQPPMVVAKRLSYKLTEDATTLVQKDKMSDIFESVETAPPGFINLRISSKWLLKLLTQNFKAGNNYGVTKDDVVKRIALEHSNVNPNKAAHIGHLRNACIGQFIERIYEMQGFAVEVQYYANNVGVQVATSMMGIERLTQYSPTSYKKYDHFAWDVYAEMEAKISADEKLQEERLNILQKLEDSTSPESIKQRKVATQILLEQLHTFAELGFDYDVVIFESDILAKKLWEKAFTKLKTNPNVYLADSGPSKGCWLVRLGNEPKLTNEDKALEDQIETDKIIVRSNGVATYTGKDIAYHMWKYGLLGIDFDYAKWDIHTQQKDLWTTTSEKSAAKVTFSNVDLVFDVIGVEQTYAIDVVKKALDFLGYHENAKNMKHINYGFVFLSRATAEQLGIDVSDGKKFYAMSGRKGWGIKIDDLIAAVDAKLAQEHGEFSELKKVRSGAIKFSMLKLNTFQDLIFDLEESLDIKGYSGPYLQYAYVRANSVLKKAQIDGVETLPNMTDYAFEPKERALIGQLIRFPKIINKASEAFAPNLLCDYLFETAKRFNTFYNDLSILNAESEITKQFRLYVCQSFAGVVRQGLWLLGIDAPDRM